MCCGSGGGASRHYDLLPLLKNSCLCPLPSDAPVTCSWGAGRGFSPAATVLFRSGPSEEAGEQQKP